MFLSNAAVRRPVAMGCLFIGLALLGINAYRKMGLEMLPKVDIPYVTIITVYPGATPEEIETEIARRIEDEVVSISGLKHVNSTAMEDMCQNLLEFDLDVDVDIAAMDVREKLDLIRADLPEGAEDPKVLKFDINATPILTLALAGSVPLDELYDYADNELKDRLTVTPGVANVDLIGGSKREVHIAMDRDRLGARGLTSLDVVRAVQNGVRTIPSGRIRAGGTEYAVKFYADFSEIAPIGDIEVAGRDGRRCYVRDIAEVRMASAEARQAAFIDGKPAVAIKVVKKAEANAVKVVDELSRTIESIRADLPGGMDLVWVTDDRAFTAAMVRSAWTDVGQGILLTALILLLFLHDLRTTAVVSITMPLTILIGLYFMHLGGLTLNAPTLLSIGMSVGILVTNAIVVLEAIASHLEKGSAPAEAARRGAADAFIPVLASAGTNVVVLLPIAALPGLFGLFIKSFAVTMIIVTLVSLFMCFTLTPLLCAILLKPRAADRRGPIAAFERGWDRALGGITGAYLGMLNFLERHRTAAVGLIAAIALLFAHSLYTAGQLGSSMMATVDRGEISVRVEFPTRYDLPRTVAELRALETRLDGLPHLRHILTTAGKVEGVVGQTSEGVYLAQMLLRFNERTERAESIHDLAAAARGRLHGVPGAIITVSVPASGGQGADLEFEIAGPDLDELNRLALAARDTARGIPGILDPDTTVRAGKPELRVRPDRAVLADLGFAPANLGAALRANIEGLTAGVFKQRGRSYDLVVKMDPREGRDQVRDFLFPGAPGMPVTLEGLGRIEERETPVQIPRTDKQRVARVYVYLARDLPMGTAAAELLSRFEECAPLPPGYSTRFPGNYEIMAEAMAALAEAGIIATVLVALALAAILESFRQPALILVTLPLALIGVVYGLYLGGYSMGVFVMMSVVMLIGIVVNNAILIMDQFNVLVARGERRHRAMAAAASDRFRAIAMITLAAVLGMLPLALGRGIGAEMRNDVGLASAGGIMVSGILTLLVIPVLYNLMTRRGPAGGS